MPEDNKANTNNGIQPHEHKKNSQRGLWVIIGAGVLVLISVVVVGSFWVDSQRIRFITEFSLTVALATLVGLQAYIYRRQWETMEQQGKTMQEQLDAITKQAGLLETQTKIMGDSLIIGAQAYVCVHSVELDWNTNNVYISVENLGKVPADSVEVFVSIDLRKPPHFDKADRRFKKLYRYGRATELFAGSLKLVIRIPVGMWLMTDELSMLKNGKYLLTMQGDISFLDGFEPRQPKKTRFAFKYKAGDRRWLPLRIYLPEELEEKATKEREETNPN